MSFRKEKSDFGKFLEKVVIMSPWEFFVYPWVSPGLELCTCRSCLCQTLLEDSVLGRPLTSLRGFTRPISALPRRGIALCASGFHCCSLLPFRPSHSSSMHHPISASDTLGKASVINLPHWSPVFTSASPSRRIPGRPHLSILLARMSPRVYRIITLFLSLWGKILCHWIFLFPTVLFLAHLPTPSHRVLMRSVLSIITWKSASPRSLSPLQGIFLGTSTSPRCRRTGTCSSVRLVAKSLLKEK